MCGSVKILCQIKRKKNLVFGQPVQWTFHLESGSTGYCYFFHISCIPLVVSDYRQIAYCRDPYVQRMGI